MFVKQPLQWLAAVQQQQCTITRCRHGVRVPIAALLILHAPQLLLLRQHNNHHHSAMPSAKVSARLQEWW